MAKVKNQAKGKGKEQEIPVNSKGNRKNYKKGVVGWQQYLANMRFFVNLAQHASGIGTSKGLLDIAKNGIIEQEKELAKQLVKVPARLFKRKELAKKDGMPQHELETSDYFKELRKFVELLEKADTDCKKTMLSELAKVYETLTSANCKVPSRLNKKVLGLLD